MGPTLGRKSSRKGGRSRSRRTSGLAEQAGYVGAGLHALLGAVGAAVQAVGRALAWASSRLWALLVGERARQPFGVALTAFSLFTLVALFDYRQGEGNVCGLVGRNLAEWLVVFLGLGAFVLPAFGAFWGLARIFRERGEGDGLPKFVGTLLLAGCVALIGQAVGDPLPTNSFPEGHGGVLGRTVLPPLTEALGPVGLTLLLAALTLVSLLLATEWAFVPLVRDLLRRSAAPFRQQELPLEAEKEPKPPGALRRVWRRIVAWVHDLVRPYEVEGAEGPAAAAAEGGDGPRLRRLTLHGQPIEEAEAETADGDGDGGAGEDEEGWEDEEYAEEEEYEEEGYEDDDEAYEDEEEEEDEGDEVLDLPPIGIEPEPRGAAVPNEEAAPRRRRQRKPRLDSLPPASILVAGKRRSHEDQREEINRLGAKLQSAFDAFGLQAEVIGAERGPTLTMFEVQLGTGVSVRRLKNQIDDLGVALGTHGVRIVHPLPGRSTVGVEVPNLERDPVRLKEVYEEVDLSWESKRVPMVLGRDTLGRPAAEDLAVMPHMLIAGATGSGKSVCLNSILVTMLLTRTPDQVRMVLIDPKQVELQVYSDIPHLLCPVVTDMKRAPFVLEWAVRQMEDRLHMFKLAGVRNVADYNELGERKLKEVLGDLYDAEEFPDTLPYYVIVIDELADLMMTSRKEVETAIARLAAKARAAGIHLIVATQRPSTDVVTGLIKTNLPVRMAFRVTSGIDSRVILDEGGAESLLGNGDFLYRPPGAAGLVRGQGAFVSTKEVREVCDHLRKHGKPEFLEDLVQEKGGTAGAGAVDDPLFDDAVRVILQSGRGSASLIQRALSVGYTRASRLIDLMTEQGVLGPFVGSKAREVLITLEEWEERQKEKLGA